VDERWGYQLPKIFLTKQVQSIYFYFFFLQSNNPIGLKYLTSSRYFFNLQDLSAESMVRFPSSSLDLLLETEWYRSQRCFWCLLLFLAWISGARSPQKFSFYGKRISASMKSSVMSIVFDATHNWRMLNLVELIQFFISRSKNAVRLETQSIRNNTFWQKIIGYCKQFVYRVWNHVVHGSSGHITANRN